MSLDLVIPAHNEAERIGPTIVEYLAELGPEDRILVALDSCTDSTAAVVGEAAGGDARVLVYSYPKLGKGGVIIETFRRCSADLVGFVDADGATPPAELGRLVHLVEQGGVDGAIAGRRHAAAVLPRSRPLARRVTSAGFAFGVKQLFHLPYADTQCGAKVLRRSVVEACLPLLSARDFLFDVDLLLTAERLGAEIAEVPTVWIDRERSRLDVARDSRRMALSSLSLWLHHQTQPVAPPAATLPAAVTELAATTDPAITTDPTVTGDRAGPLEAAPGEVLEPVRALAARPLRALPEPAGTRRSAAAGLQAAGLQAAMVARVAARRAKEVAGGGS